MCLTLPLSGRQEGIAIDADSSVACPLQGLVRRCHISTGSVSSLRHTILAQLDSAALLTLALNFITLAVTTFRMMSKLGCALQTRPWKDTPWKVMSLSPPGSYLVASHLTGEEHQRPHSRIRRRRSESFSLIPDLPCRWSFSAQAGIIHLDLSPQQVSVLPIGHRRQYLVVQQPVGLALNAQVTPELQ